MVPQIPADPPVVPWMVRGPPMAPWTPGDPSHSSADPKLPRARGVPHPWTPQGGPLGGTHPRGAWPGRGTSPPTPEPVSAAAAPPGPAQGDE